MDRLLHGNVDLDDDLDPHKHQTEPLLAMPFSSAFDVDQAGYDDVDGGSDPQDDGDDDGVDDVTGEDVTGDVLLHQGGHFFAPELLHGSMLGGSLTTPMLSTMGTSGSTSRFAQAPSFPATIRRTTHNSRHGSGAALGSPGAVEERKRREEVKSAMTRLKMLLPLPAGVGPCVKLMRVDSLQRTYSSSRVLEAAIREIQILNDTLVAPARHSPPLPDPGCSERFLVSAIHELKGEPPRFSEPPGMSQLAAGVCAPPAARSRDALQPLPAQGFGAVSGGAIRDPFEGTQRGRKSTTPRMPRPAPYVAPRPTAPIWQAPPARAMPVMAPPVMAPPPYGFTSPFYSMPPPMHPPGLPPF